MHPAVPAGPGQPYSAGLPSPGRCGNDTAGVPGGRIALRPSDLDRSLRLKRDVRYPPFWAVSKEIGKYLLAAHNWII
jgi:hypothetical protein